MLRIDVEFRKGVLFVRLEGKIDNDNYLDQINTLIEKIGIKYVVLNIDNIKDVNISSINNIINYNKQILKKNRHLLICDSNINRERIFKQRITSISSEIDAFSLI